MISFNRIHVIEKINPNLPKGYYLGETNKTFELKEVKHLKDLEKKVLRIVNKTYTLEKYNIKFDVTDIKYNFSSKKLKKDNDLKLIYDKNINNLTCTISEKNMIFFETFDVTYPENTQLESSIFGYTLKFEGENLKDLKEKVLKTIGKTLTTNEYDIDLQIRVAKNSQEFKSLKNNNDLKPLLGNTITTLRCNLSKKTK